jgi:hypothetical protein
MTMKNASTVTANGFNIGVDSSRQALISNDDNTDMVFNTAAMLNE